MVLTLTTDDSPLSNMTDLRGLISPLMRDDKQSREYLLSGPTYSDSKQDPYNVPHDGETPENVFDGRVRKISAFWRVCVEFALAVLLVSWWNSGGNAWASAALLRMRSSCVRSTEAPTHLVGPTNFDWDKVCLLLVRRLKGALANLTLLGNVGGSFEGPRLDPVLRQETVRSA